MSVEFSNAYQEILLDNLMAIIKQNFIFQTQLKMGEGVGKDKEELQSKYNELLAKYNSIEVEVRNIETYKAKANVNDSAHQEKSRIQGALNDEMKKNAGLVAELESKNQEITNRDQEIQNLKDYILKLEEIAPNSKLKKINPEKAIVKEPEPTVEPAPADLFKVLTDGSTF